MRKFVHDQRRLQFTLVLAITFLFAALVLRSLIVNRAQADLCNVIYSLVARSGATVGKPGTPGYAYYQHHPDELKLARQQNREFLHKLPCKGR